MVLMVSCTFVFVLVARLLLVIAPCGLMPPVSAVATFRIMLMMQTLHMIELGSLCLVQNTCCPGLLSKLRCQQVAVLWIQFSCSQTERSLYFLRDHVRIGLLSSQKWNPAVVMRLGTTEGNVCNEHGGQYKHGEEHNASCALDLPSSLAVLVFVCQGYVHIQNGRLVEGGSVSRLQMAREKETGGSAYGWCYTEHWSTEYGVRRSFSVLGILLHRVCRVSQ